MRPFRIEELGSHFRIQATQIGSWVKLHNPHVETVWVHESQLGSKFGWRDHCKEIVRKYLKGEK